MSTSPDPFGPEYADAYDALYSDKDYKAECDIIEMLGQRFLGRRLSAILDLGCGTGRHAIELASRGHRVDGVDRSSRMLAIARSRVRPDVADRVRFMDGDVRSVRTSRKYDVVLLMFAVLGYQLTDGDVRDTLRTARAHLEQDGVLVFDFWYGPAVEAIGPEARIRSVELPEGRLERRAAGRLDGASIASVTYEIVHSRGGRETSRTQEIHRMRYFTRPYLERQLRRVGLALREISAFPDVNRPADETSWNALAVAQITTAPLPT